jgi:predicted RNA-binding Zn-ribbon protein involved in translation (DUF1610 family)
MEAHFAEQNAAAEGAAGEMQAEPLEWGEDAAHMRAYSCPSCGAELICDETTAATTCPYCGNPTVVPGQFSGTRKPDLIIPFKLSREQAVAALKKHYQGKPLLPRAFAEENHLQEIKGVYVPFWLFDGSVDGDVTFKTTRTHTHRSGNERIITTDHFEVWRKGVMPFRRVPVDGASKMPDAHMDAIEPFDYQDLKPFSLSYLPGFLADRYDVTVEEANERADKRFIYSLEAAFEGTLKHYTTYLPYDENPISIERGKVHYALLPVWLLNVKWNGGDYLFAVNGQTGKICGQLPVSKGRAWAFFAKLAIPLSILGVILAHIVVG